MHSEQKQQFQQEDGSLGYLLLFCVVIDILSAQASSVLSEWVFPSSKETCTAQWSNLSSQMLKALQFLKYKYKQNYFSFTDGWIADKVDYSLSELTEATFNELVEEENYNELNEILKNLQEPVDSS